MSLKLISRARANIAEICIEDEDGDNIKLQAASAGDGHTWIRLSGSSVVATREDIEALVDALNSVLMEGWA